MLTDGRLLRYLRDKPYRDIFREGIAQLVNIVPFKYRLRYRMIKNARRHPSEALAHPLKIIEVDPSSVIHDGQHFNNIKNIGRILGGTWDLNPEVIQEKRIYQGLHSRFIEGYPWEETEYWLLAVERLEEKGWFLEPGYTSLQDVRDHRLPYLDDLYESISTEGYRTQSQLGSDSRDKHRHPRYPKRHRITHEVGVNIARDGEILLNSGIHRLTLAKLAGLDEIPVLVVVRHFDWQRTRDEIATGEKEPFDHPDLGDLPPA